MSPAGKCYTADLCSGYSFIDCLKKVSGSRKMKDSGGGEAIECSLQMTASAPMTDIYFLEADTQTRRCTQHKTEERNLENLFISPAGREMLKYKPTTKMKPPTRFQNQTNFSNPQISTTTRAPSLSTISRPEARSCGSTSSGPSTSSNQYFSLSTSIRPVQSCSSCGTPSSQESSMSSSRQSSIDLLYEEAAAILGLTCAQTDDCRCIECQCHYFDDFEEPEIDLLERVNSSRGPGNDICPSSLLNRDPAKMGVGGAPTSTPSSPSSQESTCAIQ